MKHIIMLSGKQGAGKSTVAAALTTRASELGYQVNVLKFADILYMMHDTLLNIMSEVTGKPRPKKDGLLLQMLGTEWGRKTYGANVWVDIIKRRVDQICLSGVTCFIIIDDCRFENEFEGIPEALRVRLACSEKERRKRTQSWRENTEHPSETGLDRYEEQGKFDLLFDTSEQGHAVGNVNHIVSMVFSKLLRGDYLERK